MDKIVIIPCPRPDNEEYTYPSYHDMLDYFCRELRVPGAQDFAGAVKFIKEKIERYEQLMVIYKIHDS